MDETSGSTKMSQDIAQSCEEDLALAKIEHQHAIAPVRTASNGVTIMQYWKLDVECDNASWVTDVELKRSAAVDWRTGAQPLSAHSVEMLPPSRLSADVNGINKTNSSLFATMVGLVKTPPSEDSGPSLPSPLNFDRISPLLLWVSQISNDHIPVAERLEKSKWETPRLEKL